MHASKSTRTCLHTLNFRRFAMHFACMHTYVCTCICVCDVCIYIYTHTHTHARTSQLCDAPMLGWTGGAAGQLVTLEEGEIGATPPAERPVRK